MNRKNILKIMSGDNDGLPIECRNPDNEVAVDISSFAEIEFTVQDKKGRMLINKKLTDVGAGVGIKFVTDGSDGQATIYITKQDTHNLKGIYDYDLQFTDASGIITTPVKSFIIVKKDITT